jgi:small multidrug resistance pump
MLLILYVIFTVAGVVLIKLGTVDFAFSFKAARLSFSANINLIIGLCCYVVSFCLWILLIKSYKLSFIVPVSTGIVQVLVLIFSYIIFKEKISALHIMGVVAIVAGVAMMNI